MIKNKIIFGLILLLSACTTSEGRYGILTSRPTPLKYCEQNNHVIKEQVTMSASEGWFLFIPFWRTVTENPISTCKLLMKSLINVTGK